MFNLSTILKAIPLIGPSIAAIPEIKNFVEEAISALHPKDQQTAKDALAKIMAENDAGHQRLQAKLTAASKR